MKYLLLTGLYLIWGLVWGCSQSPKPSTSPSSVNNKQSLETSPSVSPATRFYPLKVAANDIEVELACTFSEQSQGLMFRKKLAENHGMLFIFSRSQTLSFWMKNTLIPLDIAYIDDTGKIIDIQTMAPETTVAHPSKSQAQYALEMNQGWFKDHNVDVGTSIDIPECPSPGQS